MAQNYWNEEKQCYMPVVDVEDVVKANNRLVLENRKLKIMLGNRILVAEDGSVDIDQLEDDGFYVISYRQGSMPPHWLSIQTD